MKKLRFSNKLNNMPKTTLPINGRGRIGTQESDSQAHQTLRWQRPSEQGEEIQCFCSGGTLRIRGLSSPSFGTMTWAVQSWSSSLLDVPMILGQDPWPALSGSSCPEATGQISVASCRAACMERRVDISIWNAEDRLAFVLHQALCQQNSPR